MGVLKRVLLVLLVVVVLAGVVVFILSQMTYSVRLDDFPATSDQHPFGPAPRSG